MIELMITVAVLAVLLAIAVPSFSDYFERARLRAAVDDVVSLSQQARAEAMRLNLPVAVAFVSGANWCAGAQSATMPALGEPLPTTAAACNCAGGACLVGDRDLRVLSPTYSGVTISNFAASDDNYNIDPRVGLLANVATTPSVLFTSSKAKYQLRVDVSPLGSARACIPSGSVFVSGYGAC